MSDNRTLALAIARDLFTSGLNGQRAKHLQLHDDQDRYMCGWSESAMADRIERLLDRESQKEPA